MESAQHPRFPWLAVLIWTAILGLSFYGFGAYFELPFENLGALFGIGAFLTWLLVAWVTRKFSKPFSVKDDSSSIQVKDEAPSFNTVAIERETWFEMFQSMSEENRLERFMRLIPPQIQQLFPGTALGIYVRDVQETLTLYLRSGDDFPGPATMLLSDCDAMSKGQMVETILTKDKTEPTLCNHHGHASDVTALCIPIIAEEQFLGLFSLYHPQAELQKTPELRTSLLQKALTFSSALAIFLQKASMHRDMEGQAIRDPLTGLFNRRYMEETLLREFAEATRRGTPIGMVMVYPDQIDHIRGTLGDKAADQLCWEIGQRLPRYIRIEDIPCRHDNDLFCIILPGAALDVSLQRGEKIRKELGSLSILFQNQPLTSSFSVGVAVFPQHANTVHAFVATAEMAVRNALRHGGNRVSLPPQDFPE